MTEGVPVLLDLAVLLADGGQEIADMHVHASRTGARGGWSKHSHPPTALMCMSAPLFRSSPCATGSAGIDVTAGGSAEVGGPLLGCATAPVRWRHEA